MKFSFIEVLFILWLAWGAAIFYRMSECHDKGGALIEGQCIDVKIIK